MRDAYYYNFDGVGNKTMSHYQILLNGELIYIRIYKN